jgi:hypothetical protein
VENKCDVVPTIKAKTIPIAEKVPYFLAYAAAIDLGAVAT